MKSPCKYPGCQTLVNRLGWCEKHYVEPKPRRKLTNTAQDEFRSTYKWQRVRKQKLAMNPICEDPFKEHQRRGLTETAKQVHHIIGLLQCANDERAYSLDNLMSLCWRCHARIEREETKRRKEMEE